MNKIKTLGVMASFAIALGTTSLVTTAAHADGEKVFKKCKACHALEAGKNKVGPSLAGVVGRAAGSADGYKYSKINIAAGKAGLVWSEENIVAYLENPQNFLKAFLSDAGAEAKGRTKMAFKLKKEADRQAVVEYIKGAGS